MIYLSIPILLILAIFQATILSHTSILGVAPQLLPLIALCFALLRKPDEAFVWAFVAGLSIDLLSVAPLGSTSIALMAAVLALILIKLWLPTNHFLLPLVLTGLGMFMFLLINLSLLQLSGYPVDATVLIRIPVSALMHALLAMPLYWLLRGLFSGFGLRIGLGRGRKRYS